MPATLSDGLLDGGVQYLTDNGETLHICSQQPTTYTEATATYSLGSKAAPSIGSPEDGDVSGRKAVIAAITDGSVASTGTARHFAVVKDTATSELLLTQALASSQSVTSGNTFTLGAINFTIPDPTS